MVVVVFVAVVVVVVVVVLIVAVFNLELLVQQITIYPGFTPTDLRLVKLT